MLDGQGADEYFLGYKEFERQLIFDFLKNYQFLKAYTFLKSYANQKKTSVWQEIKILRNEYQNGTANENGFGINFRKTILELSLEEIETTSIPYQLHSEDRNSMLNSIESRLPFLDYRLVEFISSITPEKRINKGVKKSILRDAVSSLPLEIKNRYDKLGFVAPDSIFIAELGNDFEKIVMSLKNLNSIDPKFLNNIKTDRQNLDWYLYTNG